MIIKNLKIYKCPLLIVSSDSRVNCDESKRKNIENAKTEQKKVILVQHSISQRYFKEIVTKEKIPVYRIQEIGGNPPQEPIIYHFAPNKPYFIQYEEKLENEEYRENTLEEATIDEIVDYLQNTDIEEMKRELDYIFHLAEENYQQAANRKQISNQAMIKKLLRNY